jgi:hypothetical protein
MEDKKTYEIYLIKKIPLLTNGLFILFFIGAFFLLMVFEFLSSTKYTSEILTFFIMTSTVSTAIIKLLYGTIFSTLILLYLYLLARQKVKGVIIFNKDSFDILLKNEEKIYTLSNIRRVYCNDSEDRNGEPNQKFTMTIETWKNKKILVRIRNTTDIRKFIDKILSYDELKVDYITLTPLE